MSLIKLRWGLARDREATLSARGFSSAALAAAEPQVAALAGNPRADWRALAGHPPAGRYRLEAVVDCPPDVADEYGSHLIAFAPVSGDALRAEAAGRTALLIHGGQPGKDGRLRRTTGGVRVPDRALWNLVTWVRSRRNEIIELDANGVWWKAWGVPASRTPARPVPPPVPYEGLLPFNRGRMYDPGPGAGEGDTVVSDTGWSNRSPATAVADPPSPRPLRGGGGEYAGGGASASWDDPRPVPSAPTPSTAAAATAATAVPSAATLAAALAAIEAAAPPSSDARRDKTADRPPEDTAADEPAGAASTGQPQHFVTADLPYRESVADDRAEHEARSSPAATMPDWTSSATTY